MRSVQIGYNRLGRPVRIQTFGDLYPVNPAYWSLAPNFILAVLTIGFWLVPLFVGTLIAQARRNKGVYAKPPQARWRR